MTTAASLRLPEWDRAVTETREPFWLCEDERRTLRDTISAFSLTTTLFPRTRQDLDAVLTELGVAEAREQVWPDKSNIVRRTRGYTSDTLPIRMSEDELRAVLSIPSLPMALHQRLAPTTETE